MKDPARPAVDSTGKAGPRRQAPRPRLIPALLLGLACALAAGIAFVTAPGDGANGDSTVATNQTTAESTDRLAAETPKPEAEPEPEASPAPAPPPPAPESRAVDPSANWPPARAFTARCRAPGGGCAAGCAALAGDRCVDPCFIHTDACSRDCILPDGTCGWPPPDTE